MGGDLWTLAAERAARWWAGRAPSGRSDWREWVGVAWEGIARRAESRARRGLPPMDDRQVHLAARSALVDEVRKGEGGFSTARNHSAPLLRTFGEVLGADSPPDFLDHRTSVVVPELPGVSRVKYRYTPAEVRVLRQALRAGARASDVAPGLGRTTYGVQRKWYAMGFGPGRTGRPPDHERRAELFRLLSLGYSLNVSAKLMNVNPASSRTMAKRLARAGLVKRVGGLFGQGRYVPATEVVA